MFCSNRKMWHCLNAFVVLALTLNCIGQVGGISGREPGPQGASPGSPQSTPGAPQTPPGAATPGVPAVALFGLTKLTAVQYAETIRQVFGEGALAGLETSGDLRVFGFYSVGARQLTVSQPGMQQYLSNANRVAQWAMKSSAFKQRYAACQPASATDGECARSILAAVAKRLGRGRFDADAIGRYAAVATQDAEAENDFWLGLQYALAGMLTSPLVTHRIEIGEGTNPRRFTGHEQAERLAYFLWGGPPDDLLIEAAESGALLTTSGQIEQVDRMLAHDRFRVGVAQFADDLLLLDRAVQSKKDSTLFPMADASLMAEMRESALLSIQDGVVARKLPWVQVFEQNSAFVGPKLASLYKLPARQTMKREVFAANSLRTGLLTEPALLTALAHEKVTSPTLRGKFILTRLWCGQVPPPPADVDVTIPDVAQGKSRREQIGHYTTNSSCKGCHLSMDPLGFPLEHFNAIGAEQANDNGVAIDATGSAAGKSFNGPKELSAMVVSDQRFLPCLARNSFRHAFGIDVADGDPAVTAMVASAQADNGTLQSLFRAVAVSEGFVTGTPAEP